jgi:hypothetical protein
MNTTLHHVGEIYATSHHEFSERLDLRMVDSANPSPLRGWNNICCAVVHRQLHARDWSGITGNPVMLAPENVSVFLDIIFMVQHYCFYRGNRGKAFSEGKEDPLIDDSSRRIE